MTIKNPLPDSKVSDPAAVAKIFFEILKLEQPQDQEKEHFWIMGLKSNNVVRFIELITLGILNASLVHPREVMRPLIINNVASFILCHNHPSGEFFPSSEDRIITQRLKEVGKMIDIQLIDHVIIAPLDAKLNGYFSFKEQGEI